MKLSKSKLALAKVINENGGWRDEAAGIEAKAPLVFNADEYGTSSTVIDGEHLDVAIDEAMQCK